MRRSLFSFEQKLDFRLSFLNTNCLILVLFRITRYRNFSWHVADSRFILKNCIIPSGIPFYFSVTHLGFRLNGLESILL